VADTSASTDALKSLIRRATSSQLCRFARQSTSTERRSGAEHFALRSLWIVCNRNTHVPILCREKLWGRLIPGSIQPRLNRSFASGQRSLCHRHQNLRRAQGHRQKWGIDFGRVATSRWSIFKNLMIRISRRAWRSLLLRRAFWLYHDWCGWRCP